MATHTLKEDTYVTLDGTVCDATDPAVQTFVGVKGTEISEDDAKKYGLVKGGDAAPHDDGHDPENAADPVIGGVPTLDGDVGTGAKKR